MRDCSFSHTGLCIKIHKNDFDTKLATNKRAFILAYDADRYTHALPFKSRGSDNFLLSTFD